MVHGIKLLHNDILLILKIGFQNINFLLESPSFLFNGKEGLFMKIDKSFCVENFNRLLTINNGKNNYNKKNN